MSNNLKEIKTTIAGSVFLIVGLFISVYEYFKVSELALSHYLFPIGFMVVGLGLLFAPDRFIDFAFKWGNKKIK